MAVNRDLKRSYELGLPLPTVRTVTERGGHLKEMLPFLTAKQKKPEKQNMETWVRKCIHSSGNSWQRWNAAKVHPFTGKCGVREELSKNIEEQLHLADLYLP